MLNRLPNGAAERSHENALVVRLADDVFRGWPERVRNERNRVLHRHLEVGAPARGRPAEQAFDFFDVVGERRHAIAIQQIVDPLAVRRRDHLVELLFADVALVLADVLGGDDRIDAVGLAIDVLVDPLQLELELLRAIGHGAQHPEPTGPAHRRHDVAAMAERKDGKLDPQPLTDLSLHANTQQLTLRKRGQSPFLQLESRNRTCSSLPEGEPGVNGKSRAASGTLFLVYSRPSSTRSTQPSVPSIMAVNQSSTLTPAISVSSAPI